MQKITTCLRFDGQAEEAAKFYVSVFRNSKIKQTVLYVASSAVGLGAVAIAIAFPPPQPEREFAHG